MDNPLNSTYWASNGPFEYLSKVRSSMAKWGMAWG